MWREAGKDCIMTSFINFTLGQILLVINCKRMRWAGHVTHGKDENLVRKPEGKRPCGRPSRRWEYNIRMDLREIG
jgi:hypothetical protein